MTLRTRVQHEPAAVDPGREALLQPGEDHGPDPEDAIDDQLLIQWPAHSDHGRSLLGRPGHKSSNAIFNYKPDTFHAGILQTFNRAFENARPEHF